MAWNANGIKDSLHELKEELYNNQIDILLLNETWLLPSQQLKINGYTGVRKDRRHNRGGGVAIFVRNSFSFYEISLPASTQMEVIAINIIINRTTMTFCSIYKPPRNSLDIPLLDHIFNTNLPTLIAGDWNCKNGIFYSLGSNRCGRILRRYCLNKFINIHSSTTPTHIPPQVRYRPDVIDFGLSRNFLFNIKMYTKHILRSPHNPIFFQIDFLCTHKRHIVKRTDWPVYHDLLTNEHTVSQSDLNTAQSVDDAVTQFTQVMQNAIKESSNEIIRPGNQYGLPRDILQKIRHKNYIRGLWQRYRRRTDKIALNRLNREIKNEVQNHVNGRFTDFIESASTEDNSIWKAWKLCKPKSFNIINKLQSPSGIIVSDSEIANTLATSFERQFTPNQIQSYDTQVSLRRRVAQYIHHHIHNHTQHIEPTDITEVIDVINKLNIKKAAGYDGIGNLALKNLPHNMLLTLSNIFNAAINLNYFPSPWKHSIIRAIHKNGLDPMLPGSYRPISLLSNGSKVFERIIAHRFENVLTTNNIIRPEQHGFRREHSCVTQLIRVTDFITESINHYEYVAAAFFDISKAFDKCDHPTLLAKMIDSGIPAHFVIFFYYYLTGRTFQVKNGDVLSSKKNIRASVPQGSVLGPQLFLIYINTFPAPDVGILALFADDAVVLCNARTASRAANNLQETVDEITDWCEENDIVLNQDKCKFVWFAKRTKIPPLRRLYIDDRPMRPVRSVKYLGCIFNRTMTFTPHVKYACNKANKILGALNKITFPQAKLSLKNKILLFKSILRPTLLYASPAWAPASITNIRILQRMQNKILRRFVRAPYFIRNYNIHQDLSLPKIFSYIKQLNKNQFELMSNSEFQHIKDIVDYDEALPPRSNARRKIYRRPKQIFHLRWENLRY